MYTELHLYKPEHSSVHSRTFQQVSQSIPQHQTFSLPIRSLSKELGRTPSLASRSTKAISLCLPTVRNFSCSWQMTKIASVVPAWEIPKLLFVNSHHMSNELVGNILNDFHSLLCQFLSSIVTLVQSISPFPL